MSRSEDATSGAQDLPAPDMEAIARLPFTDAQAGRVARILDTIRMRVAREALSHRTDDAGTAAARPSRRRQRR